MLTRYNVPFVVCLRVLSNYIVPLSLHKNNIPAEGSPVLKCFFPYGHCPLGGEGRVIACWMVWSTFFHVQMDNFLSFAHFGYVKKTAEKKQGPKKVLHGARLTEGV